MLMENKYSTEEYKKIKESEKEELKNTLNDGIKNALDSERYKSFLNVMSKCHNYSYTNSLLIALQNDNATIVKSFKDWKKDGVNINKNEKGIKIFYPIKQVFIEYQKDDKGRIALDENGDKIEVGKNERITFRVGRVFDISQTNADREKYELKKESAEKILNKDNIISTLEKISGIKIEFNNNLGRANGRYNPDLQKIEVRGNMGDIKTISTCVHEVAHSLLHNKNSELNLSKGQKEFEAESVAYVVCKNLNVDSKENNFLYLANWVGKEDISEFKDSLDRIQKTSNDILKEFSIQQEKNKNKQNIKIDEIER